MVVFESHGEYVISHMYDITEQYRNLDGDLAFLSANDFFRDVVIRGNSMTSIGRFRDLGRPKHHRSEPNTSTDIASGTATNRTASTALTASRGCSPAPG